MGAEGVSSRLAGTRQRPCCCLGATGATSSLATQQQPCAGGRRRDCASPGPDTHPWAQGMWHLSAFSPQNTRSPLPASLSPAKAISDPARFVICGLLTVLWILLSAWLSSGPVSPRTSLRAAHQAVPLPSLTSSHQPCPCISRSLPAAPALQGLFPVPQPGSGAAQTSPAHGDAWLQPPGISGVSLGRMNTLTHTRNR